MTCKNRWRRKNSKWESDDCGYYDRGGYDDSNGDSDANGWNDDNCNNVGDDDDDDDAV